MLSVHHEYYEHNKEPWEYPSATLVTLCPDCHKDERNKNRFAIEDELIRVLREVVSLDGLELLVDGLREFRPRSILLLDLFLSAISTAFTNEPMLNVIVKAYMGADISSSENGESLAQG